MKRCIYEDHFKSSAVKRCCVRQVYDRIKSDELTEACIWRNYLKTEFNIKVDEKIPMMWAFTCDWMPIKAAHFGTPTTVYVEVDTACDGVKIFSDTFHTVLKNIEPTFPHELPTQPTFSQVLVLPAFVKHFGITAWRDLMAINRSTRNAFQSIASPYQGLATKLQRYQSSEKVGTKRATGLWLFMQPSVLIQSLTEPHLNKHRKVFYILLRESPKFCELVIRRLDFWLSHKRKDAGIRRMSGLPPLIDPFKFEVVPKKNNRIHGFDTLLVTTNFMDTEVQYVFLTGGLYPAQDGRHITGSTAKIRIEYFHMTTKKLLTQIYRNKKGSPCAKSS